MYNQMNTQNAVNITLIATERVVRRLSSTFIHIFVRILYTPMLMWCFFFINVHSDEINQINFGNFNYCTTSNFDNTH